MATMSTTAMQKSAREMVIKELALAEMPFQVDSAEFGKVVEVEGQPIAVTVKVVAHKFEGKSEYFIEDEAAEYADAVERQKRKKAEAAETKAKKIAADQKARAEKAAAKAAKAAKAAEKAAAAEAEAQ